VTRLDTNVLVRYLTQDVRRALADYRRGSGDFADYVIGWRNSRAGCSQTVTFDRALRNSPLFSVL